MSARAGCKMKRLMTHRLWRSLILLLAFLLIPCFPALVQAAGITTPPAARGAPGSPEFGVGAVIYPDGPFLPEALNLAQNLGLDWLSVPVSWASCQPTGASAPNFAVLDPVMQYAAKQQIAVLVSINDVPAWAQSALGPDLAGASHFVTALAQRYPAIHAVEPFPGANTHQGWGAPASPAAYAEMLARLNGDLRAANPNVFLVAAGLEPLASQPAAGDMDDLEFLAALYQQNPAAPVISMQAVDPTGDPLRYPDGSEHHLLRHYEEVRRVMVENNRASDRIWITRFRPPSGKIGIPDSAEQAQNEQTNWMSQAFVQTRAQLYIGVVVPLSLNPHAKGAGGGVPSLIQSAGVTHPFYSVLREMISQNKAGSALVPGKPKEGNLAKKRP